MSRKITDLVIENVLRKATHNKLKQLSRTSYGVSPLLISNIQYQNEIYLKTFQHIVFCEYLQNPDFKLENQTNKARFLAKNSNIPLHNMIVKPNRKPQTYNLKQKLITALKTLNSKKDAYFRFIQTEQIILMMTPEQASENKKQLIFIYKWILNKRNWENKQIQKLGQDLKKAVIGKIDEGFYKNQEQKLKLRKQLQQMQSKIKSQKKDTMQTELKPRIQIESFQQKSKQYATPSVGQKKQ